MKLFMSSNAGRARKLISSITNCGNSAKADSALSRQKETCAKHKQLGSDKKQLSEILGSNTIFRNKC